MDIRRFQPKPGKTLSTPVKFAALVFGVVVLLPILALLVAAGIIASIVFGTLLLAGVVNTKVKSLFAKDSQGRKNVRIRR